MKHSRIARLAALAVLITACAPQAPTPPQPAAIRSALSTRLNEFAQTVRTKNVAGFANMFTEDATWILPDASTFTGRASIAAAASKTFETFDSWVFDQVVIDRLIVVSENEAVTFTHGNYTMIEKGKAPVKRVNPVADYWKKTADGVWRVAYELNADGPATGTAVSSR
jgi:uncharacterized protein (TIGR02246 family)